MAKCKACGGSGKVKESGKGESTLPKSGKNPRREESDWKRKPEGYKDQKLSMRKTYRTKAK